MSKLVLATSLALLTLTPMAFAASSEDCTAIWKKAGAADAKLSGDMAKPFIVAAEALKMPVAGMKDGVMTDKEFLNACMKDAFKDMK